MSEPIVSIRNTTRGTLPRVPFEAIGHHILGEKYSLSLVICGDTLSRRINKETRGKDYPANVLSFPYSKDEGEIFINIRKATREAPKFETTPLKHIAHLFIHGCFHLKGMDHSDEMEAAEDAVIKIFKLS